jgi:hypothetical protein
MSNELARVTRPDMWCRCGDPILGDVVINRYTAGWPRCMACAIEEGAIIGRCATGKCDCGPCRCGRRVHGPRSFCSETCRKRASRARRRQAHTDVRQCARDGCTEVLTAGVLVAR